jgi:hypothetical protein
MALSGINQAPSDYGGCFGEDNWAVAGIQPLYDLCLVRPLKIHWSSDLESDTGGLGDRVFRVLFQVPANRLGHGQFSGAQLKTIQEVINLTVFGFFSVLYLKEQFRWNYLVGFALILLAVLFVFKKW